MNEPWDEASATAAVPVMTQDSASQVQVSIPLYQSLWTYLLLALNLLVFLAMTLLGGSENVSVLILFGAKYNPAIVAGEYWRLLTACFVHIGVVHLFFNSYALFSLGVEVERRYGRGRFLSLYLLSGISGSVLSFVGSPRLAAGASGAIFGLVGAMIAYFATYRQQFGKWGRQRLSSVLLVAGYNLVWGFVSPGIDNLGHVGGLLAGALLGWVYCPRYQLREPSATGGDLALDDHYSRLRAAAVSGVLVLLLVAIVYLGVLRWMGYTGR